MTIPSVPPAPFTVEAAPVEASFLGSSWREGCPVPPGDLRVLVMPHWTFEGTVTTGRLVVHAEVVGPATAAFGALYDMRFPIRRMQPVTDFDADDDASMAADNTSSFNCRLAVTDGAAAWSNHAFGRAIDVNPVENPYLLGGRVLPPAGSAHVDRSPAPGRLVAGGPELAAFLDAGFSWGGRWRNPDYQHVEYGVAR